MTPVEPNRLDAGGRIDRSRPLDFIFDGLGYRGYAGDTLASALLANGVRLFGRSFKYHRKRGVYTAGPEEPNALVQLRRGARLEPNTRATMVELFDGLDAESQNRWPTLGLDLLAANQAFASLMVSGFYYKTFKWPLAFWPLYEKFIRRAAGMGRPPREPDPDHYAFEYAHCDVLVVGAGPAGLTAALAAGRSGARVILADERAEPGGTLLWEQNAIDGMPAAEWAKRALGELATLPNVRLLPRSTAFGCYDHDSVAIAERVTDHLPESPAHLPRQRLIHARAKRVVLATGAIERPLVFAGNDRPGAMLASAIRTYIHQYAVLPGRRVAVFTNNDDAYRTAFEAREAGAGMVTVIDARREIDPALIVRAAKSGVVHYVDACVAAVRGGEVGHIEIARPDGTRLATVECDVLGSSGGYAPTVHLYSQIGGKLRWDEGPCAFVPDPSRPPKAGLALAGSANGAYTLAEVLAQGHAAGAAAAKLAGLTKGDPGHAPSCESETLPRLTPMWQTPAAISRGKRFVDLQEDVSVEDLELAHRENYRSVEHLKRYTTLGMGTDQGKLSNVNGLAILAGLRGEPIPEVGTTTFRAPYTPVAMGLFGGAETGKHQTPVRRTALHHWHEQRGALMTTVGHWMRPRVYQRLDESFDAAWRRESMAVREGVALVDVGTLGKIDVQGPDAGTFLQRVYCNNMATLAVGRLRYGLMLREDGIVLDDGTLARLAENHYVLSTTTANAARVQSQFEFLLQAAWPELRCSAVSVTEQYAQFALAGPKSREVLALVLPHCDVSDAGLPHLGVLQTHLEGTPVIVYRMSYSGERAYEIAVGNDCGEALWTRILETGAPHGIVPYGTEAMGVLRIEKGHVAGGELDGRTTAADLGLGKLVRKGGGFIGAALLQRPGLIDARRPMLVGLEPVDGRTPIRAGSQLVEDEAGARRGDVVLMPGWVSAATPSEFLQRPIALGFLENGAARHGHTLFAASPLTSEFVEVRVVPPVFVDPDNGRMKG